jgi:hypothetical protein
LTTEKIYIQLLDGSTSWVPVDALRMTDNQYEIVEDKEYTESVDPLYLHEFYPGDIVELGFQIFHDGKTGQVAKKLIEGQWPDRHFKEFKFMATKGQLKIDKQTAEKHIIEIERIIKEYSAGQFFYPMLIEVVYKLSNLIEKRIE